MRDISKVTHTDGISYCDVCGYWISQSTDECSLSCPTKTKRPSARAEPQPRTWSYEDIRAAFERDREGL